MSDVKMNKKLQRFGFMWKGNELNQFIVAKGNVEF